MPKNGGSFENRKSDIIIRHMKILYSLVFFLKISITKKIIKFSYYKIEVLLVFTLYVRGLIKECLGFSKLVSTMILC